MNLQKKTSVSHCPLCGENNACGNLSANTRNEACWCMDSTITFADSLLNQVTDAAKNKVCICKACAMSQNFDNHRSS